MRSIEVARVFESLFGRPGGFGSSDFAQNVDFSCSIDLYGSRGLSPLQILIYWPRKGRILRILARKTSAEISFFVCLSKTKRYLGAKNYSMRITP